MSKIDPSLKRSQDQQKQMLAWELMEIPVYQELEYLTSDPT